MIRKNATIKKIAIGIILVAFIIFGILFIIKINSTHHKLGKIGYNKEEVEIILKSLEKRDIENTLEDEYNPHLASVLKENYFIYSNLHEYLDFAEKYDEYKNKTSDLKNTSDEEKYKNIISIVNVEAHKDWYSDIKDSNLSKGSLILVNKFNQIPEDYVAGELVDVRNWYSYGDQRVIQEVYDHFLEMWNDANREGVKLIISSAHRDYSLQNKVYNDYKRARGEKYADSIAARPGHSEHQTGLAIDITTDESYNKTEDGNAFENTQAFKWLKDNAHKYGFILRYPKNKTYLTGYSYESWHYRYVGVDAATKMYELDITFDEYYAFFEK